jgi:putative copper export protein
MPFWILVASYWIHLLATVVWLGGLSLMALVAWPALKQQTLAGNQWASLQIRFAPWANGSLVLLLITGFVQMTNDEHYSGFLVMDSLWSQAILVKHLAFLGMVLIAAYTQGWLYPAMERTALLAENKPALAEAEQTKLARQEMRLLRVNVACAVAVLLCTAVATAI